MEAAKEGVSELEIAQEYPAAWARNFKALERYQLLLVRPRNWAVETIVYWGPSGSGKSRRCRDEAPDALWVSRGNGNAVWYDGYDRHEDLVIDEFYGWISRDQMQRLCDRYPLTLQTKGGTRQCVVKRVFITSNAHPTKWWKIGMGAMQRRITLLEYVDYSAEFPCIECNTHPHTAQCRFVPPLGAPDDASRGGNSRGYYTPSGDYVYL